MSGIWGINKVSGTNSIDCRDSMDISVVSEVYEELSKVESGSTVTLNASEVDRIDAAMLQMLSAFFRKNTPPIPTFRLWSTSGCGAF